MLTTAAQYFFETKLRAITVVGYFQISRRFSAMKLWLMQIVLLLCTIALFCTDLIRVNHVEIVHVKK